MMIKRRKVCIAGKNTIAVNAMRYVHSNFSDEVELYILPNKADNGARNWQPSLRKEANYLGIPVVDLGDCYSMNDLLFISLEYDRIIKPHLFCSCALYNIHFSMLPKYKGMYTSAWPILNGESTSGVTLHEIDSGIDTGAIVEQLAFSIEEMSCRDLYLAYMENALELFKSNFQELLSGEVLCNSQSAEGASYYSKASIQFNELRLNFNVTAFQVVQQFHAYSFRQFQLPKVEGVEFCQIRILDARSLHKSGTIISRDAECFVVSTIDFDIELKIDYLEALIDLCNGSSSSDIAELLKLVTDVNEFGRQGWSPLMVAAYHNKIEAVQLLVESGADLYASNCNGTTVLMYAKDGAERAKDTSVLKWLLDSGVDTSMRDQRGKTVTEYCMENNETRSLHMINMYIS